MFTLEQKTHFWTHVKVSDDTDGCWEWQGCVINTDHGVVAFEMNTPEGMIPVSFLAHRIAHHFAANHLHSLFAGVITHACENRSCCNPNHLRPLTRGGVDYDWPWSQHWRSVHFGAFCEPISVENYGSLPPGVTE